MVAVPCAAAGVIVSMLTQTGLGLAFSTIIAGIAHGSVVLALVLAAIAALILGIGVPTTPAYILTAAVAAPALTRLGIDPLAANMFVLYFAVLSNIHPPVGITSYAAAGIADAPPMRTGMQALKIAVPGFVIPFAFAYHPALLFQGDIADFPLTAALTTASVMGIAAGLAGYLLAPLRVTERVILVLGSFLLVGRSPWIIGFGALCVLAIWAKQALQRRRAAADLAADPLPQVGHRRWQPVVVGAPAASFRDNAAATTAPRATTPSRLDANEELAMTMQVRPLTRLLGVEITGIDLTSALEEPVKQELYRLFVDNAVLVFRDQTFSPPQFATAAQLFGEIIPEQFPNYRLPEYPVVSFLSNRDLEQSGRQRAVRGEGFHTDHSNYARPAQGHHPLRHRHSVQRRRYRVRLGPGRL